MSESAAHPAPHSENFSLRDFLPLPGQSLDAQVEAFSQYYRGMAGELLYMREIQGPAGPVVTIREGGHERELVMLGSNNYLDLANHPQVKEAVKEAVDQFGVGCGGPPLLNGTTRLHRELEGRLAAMKGCEDALLFSSGFLANLGWGALLRPQDVVIYDELSHASLHDSLKLARCRSQFFGHNDTEELAKILAATRARAPEANVVVAVEGVYSMDGDLAPLGEIRALCDAHGAWLMVDDAHGTGVLGESGAGSLAHFGVHAEIVMGTFSKAFGTAGAFIAGSRALVDYLRFYARTHMFSAALPHPVVATVLAGLDVLAGEPWRLEQLHANARYLAAGLRALGLEVGQESAILPVRVPPPANLRLLARRLHEAGYFVNAIEPPAVPPEAQRLRVSVMATHTPEHLDGLVAAIARVGREVGLL